jgi:hypothetical protein
LHHKFFLRFFLGCIIIEIRFAYNAEADGEQKVSCCRSSLRHSMPSTEASKIVSADKNAGRKLSPELKHLALNRLAK